MRRDVKSSNILLTREGVAKVGDVGLAIMTDYFSSASAATGTFAYAAPEILMGKPTTEKVFGPSRLIRPTHDFVGMHPRCLPIKLVSS